MAANVGLKYALTFCGMVELVVPYIFRRQAQASQLLFSRYRTRLLLRVGFTKSRGRFILRRLKHNIINAFRPPTSPLLSLPYEIREQIYLAVCIPQSNGTLPGCLNLLLINKQMYHEAKPIFSRIPHIIQIADKKNCTPGTVAYMGMPRIVTSEAMLKTFQKLRESGHDVNPSRYPDLDWHMSSLKHLVLSISICKISTMTPDCFDVILSHHGKDQWRSLKRLIGIWPELREEPLETIRLDLLPSSYKHIRGKTYRADFIRVIRNFKRTQVWAETGDGHCSSEVQTSRSGVRNSKRSQNRNTSVLLPLVRAFNQGRRNWVAESGVESNLLVRYDQHVLSRESVALQSRKEVNKTAAVSDEIEEFKTDGEDAEEKFEKEKQRWSVVPVDDTSRSQASVWPEWTGKEEKYIQDKMIPRVRKGAYPDREWECCECLAAFDTPGELKEHIWRGVTRC